MKTCLYTLLLPATLLVLSACASTQKTAYENAPVHQAETLVQNDRYVAAVERIAQQRGIQVVWVNPPKKRMAQTVAASR